MMIIIVVKANVKISGVAVPSGGKAANGRKLRRVSILCI